MVRSSWLFGGSFNGCMRWELAVDGDSGPRTQPSITSPPPAQRQPAFKDTNPKDAVGIRKVPSSTVPRPVIAEIGLAMLEGARKYGRHNYRVAGIRASVYYDAAQRHLDAWWEGEDIDPDSGLHHVIKALATLTVLRDAMICDKCTDDRPPSTVPEGWVRRLNEQAGLLIDAYPDAKEPYTR